MKVLVHITIINDNGEITTKELNGDGCSCEQERGIYEKYDACGNVYINPNSHQRALIKLWSGCDDWDSFRKEGIPT